MNTKQALIIAKQSGCITNTEEFIIDAKGAQNCPGFAGRLGGAQYVKIPRVALRGKSQQLLEKIGVTAREV